MNSDFPFFERSASASEIKLDVSDNEIKALSEYFEKSRDELQKKVDSILALELVDKNKLSLLKEKSEILLRSNSVLGSSSLGQPIDIQTATELRELTASSCVHRLSDDWKRSKFLFRDTDSELGYGLLTEKNGSKGLILSVQCFILKNLILCGYTDINGKTIIDSKWKNERKVLKPTDTEKRSVLIGTLSEILWKAGEEKLATVVINSQLNCFNLDSNGPNKKSSYVADGYTERLHLFEFTELNELKIFIKKNLTTFQKEEGLVLFLYSLILSRRIEKVKVDLQGEKLLGDNEDCKISLFNLVLNGIATPYLHNGTNYYDANGDSIKPPQVGINARSDIGILYWDPSESDKKRTEVGSMLKTPKFPVWLAIMRKNLLTILFNTNLDLINDWRFEQTFTLHFYAGVKKQEKEFRIHVDTRNLAENWDQKKILKSKYPHIKFNDDEAESELTNLILTKWPGADVSEDGKEILSIMGK